jgi:hypothetical protein
MLSLAEEDKTLKGEADGKLPQKDDLITLNGEATSLESKIAFVRGLYDAANEKINHLDGLRQRILNYALLSFSALLACVASAEAKNLYLISVGCVGIGIVMLIFSGLDHRYHRSIHGLRGSMTVYNLVIARLYNYPNQDLTFIQYHKLSEKNTSSHLSFQQITYWFLSIVAFVGGVIAFSIG